MFARGVERPNILVVGRQELKVCYPTHYRTPVRDHVPLRSSTDCGTSLRLSDRLGAAAGREVEITLSRAELAQLTSTTMFTVSRLLCQWQSLGMVKIRRGGVQVRDFRALAHLAQSQ